MWLELIRVGGGACNTVMGLEFELIYANPLALHFALNFHVINANSKGSFGKKVFRALREHESPTIWGNVDSGTSFRCAQVMLNFFQRIF